MNTQTKEIIKVEALISPMASLDALRLKSKIYAPNHQRASIDTTIKRIKDKSSKRFSCTRMNDEYFSIKRIR